MATCSKCIIPEYFPKNEMEDGICSFCKLNSKKFGNKPSVNKEIELLSLLKNGNQTGYDCVVPISGGKDSTYILYYLVKNFKLNPLAVFFNSGFATDYAKHNVEETCRKLNVNLVIRQASLYRRKLIEEAWYISYYSGKIHNFCGNCENNIRTAAINEALKNGIKNIIWGSTDYEDTPDSFLNPSSVSFKESFAGNRNFIQIFKLFKKSIFWLFPNDDVPFIAKMKALIHRFKYMYYYVMDNLILKAPGGGLKKLTPYFQVSFKNKRTNTLYFYDYIQYDPFHQIKILEQEVGWRAPKDMEAKMDCSLHCIQNYVDLKRTGITNSGFKISVLVRNGMISREDAMNKEKMEIEHLKRYFQSENLEIQPALHVMKDLIFE